MSWSDRVLTWVKNDSLNGKDIINREGSLIAPSSAAHTPEYLIKVDEIFKTKMSGFENYTECEWYEIGSSRPTATTPSDYFNGDRGIAAKNTLVCMKYSQGMPTLHQLLFGGTCIKEIIIKRLSSVGNDILEVQALTFENCFLTTYEQKKELVFFSFSFTKIIDAQVVYDSTGQKLSGVNAIECDFNSYLIDPSSEKPNLKDS